MGQKTKAGKKPDSKVNKGSTSSTKGKEMIRLLMTGGLPGLIKGDVVENPTDAELERARKSPDCLEIINGSAAPKGGCVEEEVEEHGCNPGETDRHREDI